MKKLGMGCMRLPILKSDDPTSFDEAQICDMVDAYLKNGFVYFDTAYFYHNSQSERILKKVLVERHPRDSFVLATKMPSMFIKKEGDLERIFNEQLEKTGAEYFDYYLLHCLNANLYEKVSKFKAFDFVMEKKREGKVKKIGFSFHDSADVLDKILSEHPEMEFVQLQINYLDWDDERVQSRKCYEVALKHNKEIIVMEPVKGGKLAVVPERAAEMFKEANPDMSVASWAVRFAAGLDNVFMVLSGMSNMEQLLDNMSYMDNFSPLTNEEKALCFKAAEEIKASLTVPCTDCRYCVEGCPSKIAIPDYFAAYNNSLSDNEDVRKNAVSEYKTALEKGGKISECKECKKCEKNCPQHIEIVKALKKTGEYFDF